MRYRHATILYQEGDGEKAKHNWLQTGELIQVGKAWRIIQAPVPGIEQVRDTVNDDKAISIPTGGEKLVEQLNKHDQDGPTKAGREGLIDFNLRRAAILEQIVGLYKDAADGPKRDVWIRQVADSYAAAAQQGDAAGIKRLGQWREALSARGAPSCRTSSFARSVPTTPRGSPASAATWTS